MSFCGIFLPTLQDLFSSTIPSWMISCNKGRVDNYSTHLPLIEFSIEGNSQNITGPFSGSLYHTFDQATIFWVALFDFFH